MGNVFFDKYVLAGCGQIAVTEFGQVGQSGFEVFWGEFLRMARQPWIRFGPESVKNRTDFGQKYLK